MADVARRAGVSTATVSRALRDLPGVGEDTRERIRRIAAELSYVVSPEASRLSRGGTGRVAVVVPRINVWYFATMLAGLEAVFREAGLDVLIYHVDGAEDRRRFFERLPARRKADAVVVIALPLEPGQTERLALMGVHVVVAGGRVGDYPRVRIDDEAAATQALQHLIGLGHERIGMIRTADPEGVVWPVDLARAEGYRTALERAGIGYDDRYVVTVPHTNQGGVHGMSRLLSLPRPPTAVFAHSDEIAIAALQTLRRSHVRVPDQMSLVGVDDHPMAELVDLTTVRQDVARLGRLTAGTVLDLLEDKTLETPDVVVPTYLVVRGTTGPPVDGRARQPNLTRTRRRRHGAGRS